MNFHQRQVYPAYKTWLAITDNPIAASVLTVAEQIHRSRRGTLTVQLSDDEF